MRNARSAPTSGDCPARAARPPPRFRQHRDRLLDTVALSIDDPVGAPQPADLLGEISPALQAFAIEPKGAGEVARDGHKRGDVLENHASHRRKAVRPDCAELMHHGEGAEGDAVADLDVAGEGGSVRHDIVGTDPAVVGEVHVGHDPVPISHPGRAARPGSPVEGAELTNDVAVADLQASDLTPEFLVLGLLAEGAELEYPVVPADGGRPADHDVRTDPRPRSDGYPGIYDRARPDFHVFGESSGCIDDRARVDHSPSVRNAPMSSAWATTLSSTRARDRTFQTPRVTLTRRTSTSIWSPGTTGCRKRAPSTPTK